jgi:hypothetical protein
MAIHALEHPETRHRIGVAQPPAFYFVRLFAHARNRGTFSGGTKHKKPFLHNMLDGRRAPSTSTFFRDEPLL